MGFFSEDREPQQIIKNGKKLKCTFCDHDIFRSRKTQLNTKVASLLNLDWANKSAHCYICVKCGHVEWFMEQQ